MIVAVALLFLSLALLVYFADHLAHSLQVDHIMRVVERSTCPSSELCPPPSRTARRASCRRCRRRRSRSRPGRRDTCRSCTRAAARRGRGAAGERAGAAADRRARRRRHATGLDLAGRPGTPRLRRRTRSARAWQPRCGSASNAPSSRTPAWGCPARRPRVQGVVPGGERPLHRDPGRRTPVRAVRRARRPPTGPIVAHDPTAGVTVVVPARSFAEHLALGVGLIRRYGAQEPTVIQALRPGFRS